MSSLLHPPHQLLQIPFKLQSVLPPHYYYQSVMDYMLISSSNVCHLFSLGTTQHIATTLLPTMSTTVVATGQF